MWDQLKRIPPIVVAQSIFSYLDLGSIVRLESAVANTDTAPTFRSFLSYCSKVVKQIRIPQEISKLKWLQTNEFTVQKGHVHLDKINCTFDTTIIQEIELLDNRRKIDNSVLNYLPDGYQEKVVSAFIGTYQNNDLMEVLLSNLISIREMRVVCYPEGWLLDGIRELYRRSNKNVLIETLYIYYDMGRNTSISELLSYCPRLQLLSIDFDISVHSLRTLSRQCPLLKEFRTIYIPRIYSEDMGLQCSHALSCIHSISTLYVQSNENATVYSNAIPQLTELRRLTAASPIDHILLPLIAQYCLKLEILEIWEESSTNKTPAQLLQLAQNCPHLQKIEVCSQYFCTDEIIIALAQHCPNLSRLCIDVSYKSSITDASILALSEQCPQLQELIFKCTTKVTQAAILQLTQQCKLLHTLKLADKLMSDQTKN